MNKKLKIYPLLLLFSIGVVFCAEEPPLKKSKMEVGFPLRRSSRIAGKRLRECNTKELDEEAKTKRQRIDALCLLRQEEKDTQLVQAVKKGSLLDIENLLEAKANPGVRDEKGRTLLIISAGDWYAVDFHDKPDYNKSTHLSFIEKYPQITDILLKKNADPDVQDEYKNRLLNLLTSDGYGLLFSDNLHYDRQLHSASLDSDCQMLIMFLQNNANPKLEGKNRWVFLHLAIIDCYGIDFNRSRYYNKEFHLECLEMNLACLKELLKYVDPNTKNREFCETELHVISYDAYSKNFEGKPNFDQECWLKYLDKNVQLAKVLLDAGANPNAQDLDNNTPLHISSLANNTPMVTLLLDNHATNVTEKNQDGFMAHHLAARRNCDESLGVFLRYGVDLSARTTHGETALSLANSSLRSRLLAIKERGTETNELFLACMFGPDIKFVDELIKKEKEGNSLFKFLKEN